MLRLPAPLRRLNRLHDNLDIEFGRDRRDYGTKYESRRDLCRSESGVRPIRILSELRRVSQRDLLRQACRKAGRVNVWQLRSDDDPPR